LNLHFFCIYHCDFSTISVKYFTYYLTAVVMILNYQDYRQIYELNKPLFYIRKLTVKPLNNSF
jgi:hypothetical protein